MRSRLRCPTILPPALREQLEASGVAELYSHQAAAWDAAQRGQNVAITTGTASGKSLAFNLPVLAALTEQPKLRALYLYPTKALAQDQVRALGGLNVKHIRAAIYDGDTESERRWQVRKWSNLDPDQPGHAPRRRPAAPRPLGRRALQPPLRRRRRGARLPRRLRLARRQRAQAPAPARPRLRRRAAVPARVGDDREPRRARPRADRARLHRHRRGRSAEGRADGRALEPAARRRGAGPAGERARGGVEADGRPGRTRPADARLRQEPPLGGADPQVHGRPARRRVAPLAVPGRLHARRSAARSSSASSPASCSESARRTRSSSGSTSGCSTRSSRSASRERSPACASSGAAQGAAVTGWPSSSPARTRSTSTSCASRETLLGRRVEAAILDHENPRVLDGHVAAAAFEAPLDDADAEILGAEALRRAAEHPELTKTGRGLRLGRPRLPGRALRPPLGEP